ncbi:MAG: TonB-dependent receptor plug domain-containing protein [Deltaproteobacteria bacterium]|jgi:iron complex outermembrane receptor protein|nr:TonB-dependent receptor plug domain-containing protein [Deltaproteobacteria bacterium]
MLASFPRPLFRAQTLRDFWWKLFILAFLAFPGASGAAAQEETEEAPPERAPGESVVILSRADLEAMKVNKIQDALNQVPGVQASSSSVSIHGSSKVRVFLDGTPLNDPTSSYGAINLDHISLKSVSQIEIIKDSGGLRYGQDATGGVILITSAPSRGESDVSGQVRVWSGNHDFRHADADLLFRRGGWGLGVKAGWETTEGFKANNDAERRRGGLKIGYNWEERKSLSLNADFLSEINGLSGLPAFPTPHSRQKSENLTASLSAVWNGLENNLFYNRGQVRNLDHSRSMDINLKVAEYGDSLAYAFPLSFGTLVVGTGALATEAVSSDFGRREEWSWHFFFAQSLRFESFPLNFNVGLRYNRNSDFANSLNPEFSVAYAFPKGEISYQISRGVNTPSFQQRFNHSSSTTPNPNLDIEKAVNQALTATFRPHPLASLSATFFLNRLNGRITYVRPVNTGVGSYQNLGRSVYRGVDLGLTLKPWAWAEIKANYAYLEALDLDIDRFLTSQSRDTASLEIAWRPRADFTAAARGEFRGRSYADRWNTNSYGGRTLFSLRAEYAKGPLVFFLDADNIFDKEYYYVDGLLAPDRSYFIGIKYNF